MKQTDMEHLAAMCERAKDMEDQRDYLADRLRQAADHIRGIAKHSTQSDAYEDIARIMDIYASISPQK